MDAGPDDEGMDTSGEGQEGEEQESAYDPMAYYKQQQQEMLLQATQHVQASQEEIQQAQSQGSYDATQKWDYEVAFYWDHIDLNDLLVLY